MVDQPHPLNPNPHDRGSIDLEKYGAPFNVSSSNVSATNVRPKYDVCVIGGGIHGVGVAQAAAAAGYSVVVLEKSRLADGTSSRSSKLIHGGLRYLEQLEISLVWESLRERELLFSIAPDLVKRQKFFIPVYDQTSRKPWVMKLGLFMYAVLAGGGKNSRFKSVPRSDWDLLDGLNQNGLKRVLQYWDGQTDDAALTRAVMQSGQDLGADLFYPARFDSAEVTNDGVEVCFQFDSNALTTRANVVVNAAGASVNKVLGNFTPVPARLAVEIIQGTHIELPGAIEQGCYYVEAPDKRVVFVMPWKGRTLVGTTESKFEGNPEEVTPLDSEVEYLKDIYQTHFPDRDHAIINQWAGLRVLPVAQGKAFKRSRETVLPADNPSRPRLVSIYGGKLTGYRTTAEKVMKILSRTLPRVTRVSNTRDLHLKDPYHSNAARN
jgi:glycerol-3-phosphate dehydrogenase